MIDCSQTTHARVAAVPLAAAITGIASDWLPIRFTYVPNDLGIVSRTTMARYPAQQEVFWLVFAVGLTALLAWALARILSPIARRPRLGLALESLGVAALAAFLWMPRGASWPLVFAAGLSTVWLARSFPASATQPIAPPPSAPPLAVWPRAARIGLCIALVTLASVYSAHPMFPDGLWGGLAHVLRGTPDAVLASDDPFFQIEWGEHLAWADRLRAGQLQGRDFFCLYGPLHEYSLVALWGVLGRSVAAAAFWQGLLHAAGALCWLALGVALFRRPAWLLAFPFLISQVGLRIGLGLLGIAWLVAWQRRGDLRLCAAAGGVGGVALVFSQEFGLAFAIVGGLTLALDGRARPALAFFGALALVPGLTALAFASQGALGPVLSDLVDYPRYVAAGYANVPIRSLLDGLPLRAITTPAKWQLELHLPYALAAIPTGALLLALPLEALDPRRPREAVAALRRALLDDPARLGIAATALYGLLAYRSALGRSDLHHFVAVLAPAALLLGVGLDRAVDGLRRAGPGRIQAAFRGAVVVGVALQSGILAVADPAPALQAAHSGLAHLAGTPPTPRGSDRLEWLTAWLRDHTSVDDTIFLLPNAAGSAYLADRRNPTRFVLPAMIVTGAHRREVLDDLRSRPPRYVVWDGRGMRVDALGDKQVLGRETVEWLETHYEPLFEEHAYRVYALRSPPAPKPPAQPRRQSS